MPKKWTEVDKNTLKNLLEQDKTYSEISNIMNRSYKSVEHAICRYKSELDIIKKQENNDLFFVKNNPKKITYQEIHKLSSYLGQKIVDNYKPFKLDEIKAVYNKKNKKEEMSILDISDVHIGMINTTFDSKLGKKIVTYNHEIFLKELAKLQQSVFEIHHILSNAYKLRELTVFMLGDIITNDRIFPEQTFEIEKCVGLQIWDATSTFTSFFNNLLRIYDKINIICIVGNHGRSTNLYEEPVENNFEYFMYKVLEKQFANNKRINVVVPDTRRYIHKVWNWKHLIEHGDSIRGCTDNAIERQIEKLYTNVGGFDMMHFGHFHKLKDREIADKVIVKQSGCFIHKDDYAFKKFKTYSLPKLWFFGCNHKRPETWSYKIDLRV